MKPPMFVLVSLALLAAADRAECQRPAPSPPPPPPRSRAIFGGAPSRDNVQGGLDLSVQLSGAYDDDVLAGQPGGSAPGRPTATTGNTTGYYSGLDLGLLYSRDEEGRSVNSSIRSGARYYPDFSELSAIQHQATAALVEPIGQHFTVSVSPFAAYSPYYSLRFFPVPGLGAMDGIVPPDVAPPDPTMDFSVIKDESYVYGGNAGLNIAPSRGSSIALRYGYRQSKFLERDSDTETHTAGMHYRHTVSRSATFDVGYSRQENRYKQRHRVAVTQNADIGVSYSKALSSTRSSTLRFSVGTGVTADGQNRSTHLLGSAAFVHPIGRTWNARADFRRDVGQFDGFDQPILSNAASAGVTGLITRRIDLSTNVHYAGGATGLYVNAPRFTSYAVSARLQGAISQLLAAYIEYLIYRYEFEPDAVRPPGVPQLMHRQTLRVGLNLWLPLVN